MKYLIFLGLLGIANAHVINMNEVLDQLQAVQGLYVKPSSDGVTGDLYMAATEDNGAQSSWVADQPINFLKSPNLQPAASLPVTYSTGIAPATTHDDTAVPQRSVLNYPVNYGYGVMPMSSHGISSYAYAIPSFAAATSHASLENEPTNAQSTEGGTTAVQSQPQYIQMPFFYPGIMSAAATAYNSITDGSSKEAGGATTAVQPQSQYTPMPFFYPGIISAATTAYNSLNDRGSTEAGGATTAVQPQSQYTPMPFFYPGITSAGATAYNSLKDKGPREEAGHVGLHQAQMWSPAAFPYPAVQYMMVDPSAWAASQAGVVYGTPPSESSVVEVQ